MVDNKHLTVARHLEVDSFKKSVVGKRADRRDNRIAVGGRGGDSRQITGPHQRELQRAGYRGGTHGECVDIGLHLLELLLYGHSELLFLVDDQKSEILEFNRFGYQLVGADQNIDLAVSQIGQYLLDLPGTPRSRQIFDPDGEIFKPLTERIVVLISQYGRRHQHGGLLRVAGRLEGRTHRHLGLAESDIAAYQAVHRPVALHIGLHGLRGGQLVGSILVDKRRLKLALQIRVGREAESFLLPSGGIQAYEIAGDILEFLLGALLDAVPCAGTELVDLRLYALLATILGELVERMYRNEYRIASGIHELYHLLHVASDLCAEQSGEAPHTMIHVHYVVARLNGAKFLQRQSELT